jgi:pilus assembly protein CpaC
MNAMGSVMGIGEKGSAKRAVSEYEGRARRVAARLIMAAAFLPLAARAQDAAPPREVAPPPGTPIGQTPQDPVDSFHLYVGEARVIKLPKPIVKTAIGNGKVLSVAALDAKEMLLIANDAGRSMLHLWLDDGSEVSYAAEVAVDSPAKIYAQVKEIFGDDGGIRVNLVGNRVFLRAETLTPEQVNLVKALQQAFGDKIVLITEGDMALEERTVHVNAQLVEIKKSVLEQLGVSWSGTINGPLLDINASPFRTAFSLATQITSQINLLRTQGDAYIVAEPHLTARCGGKADFTSGGEMPIPLQNGLGSTSVEFKKYGVRLSIEPQCDKLGNIRAKVATEVSQIDDAVEIMGVPGLLTRQVESELDLVDGQAMLLSGLASYEAGKSESRVPFLGSIPLLGHLFKSTDTDGGRSELIVIITPSFVTSESETIRKSVKRGGRLSVEAKESLLDQGLTFDRDGRAKRGERLVAESEEAPRDQESTLPGAGEKDAATKARAGGEADESPIPAGDASGPGRLAYAVTGEASWRPTQVYSDGRRTVIEMPEGISAKNAPLLLVVQQDAEQAPPVRYHLKDSRYVVEAVLDRAMLVAGGGHHRESVTIARQP